MPIIPDTQEAETAGSRFKASMDKISRRPYLKNMKSKKNGNMAQAENLGSIPPLLKEKKNCDLGQVT
jgi:hypothetical protein